MCGLLKPYSHQEKWAFSVMCCKALTWSKGSRSWSVCTRSCRLQSRLGRRRLSTRSVWSPSTSTRCIQRTRRSLMCVTTRWWNVKTSTLISSHSHLNTEDNSRLYSQPSLASLKPGFHPNTIATAMTEHSYWLRLQPIGMLGHSSGNHNWLLANAIACVSCGFHLRNARNTSDCVWMETGL